MSLFLYNTLTGKKEEFKPLIPGTVSMYNCGPTVYNYAHIGNLRAYVFVDVLRRTLERNGYKVKQAMNITDVGHLTSDGDDGDDKMVKALKREGKPFTLEAMREVADFYALAFKNDLTALHINIPEIVEHASDHIPEDIELIKKLEAKGFAYRTSDGMYFDTAKFPNYGKLGNINLEGQRAGARVAVNSEKKNPADFTLWKISANDIGWESPWGKGFPGWHIECSAMSREFLGQPFDIHTGGIDHIPVHHNNEIAQSEAAYDAPLANYWLHNEFVTINEGKMAKSGDNFITLKTLTNRGISPLAYRYYLLGANYRTPMNFSFEALEASQNTYYKLLYAFLSLGKESGELDTEYENKFLEEINNDLNTPNALALLFEVQKHSTLSLAQKRALILAFDSVLGLNIEQEAKQLEAEIKTVPEEIITLSLRREASRKMKNFEEADNFRKQIMDTGYSVMDTDSGPIIRKINR